MADYLFNHKAESYFHGRPEEFWPENVIKSLRDENVVRRVLTKARDAPDEELVRFIVDHATKLFAISATVFPQSSSRLRQAMEIFQKNQFRDKDLSAEIKDGSFSLDYSALLEARLASLEDSEDDDEREDGSDDDDGKDKKKLWFMTDIRRFKEDQWKALVPTFSTDKLDYNFQMSTILPFLKMETNDDRKGAFSIVYKVSIHPSHYEDEASVSLFCCFQLPGHGLQH